MDHYSEKVAMVLEINDKKVAGTPRDLLLQYKKESEEIMATMTKEELEDLINARNYPQQYKIYIKQKFIDKL